MSLFVVPADAPGVRITPLVVVDPTKPAAEVRLEGVRLPTSAPVVRFALEAARRAGLPATVRVTNGGLDANWMVRHGIPTITFGAGQHNPHTTEEYVDLEEFRDGCRLALALATAR